jgi:hypothetical protein
VPNFHGFNYYFFMQEELQFDECFISLGKRNYNLTSEKDLRTMCRHCGLPEKAHILKSQKKKEDLRTMRRQCGLPDKAHILKSKKKRRSAHHVPTLWTARRKGTYSQKSEKMKKRKICAPCADNVDCQTGHTFSKVLSTGIHTHTLNV